MSEWKWKRLTPGWALVISSLMAPIVSVIWIIAIASFRVAGVMPLLGLVFLFGAPISLVFSCGFGMPLLLLLKKWQLLTAPIVCANSLLLGAFSFSLVSWWAFGTFLPSMEDCLAGAVLALSVSATFCLLAGVPLRSPRRHNGALTPGGTE
ncbi:hypothetical protein FHW69_000657 [Luteibacter sp. Sphag1AF]|uniref:hypothetical protein n=1 Tax=Luteibacter sp. Sphag1AF TaxID=2587031 RepID=UPI00161CE982|nr:hypothetical protein [Luteibacter sp. Sphag1AF]MBB3226067.1 hypothetical protein [Luteibacter sp. Sphag1AF]